MENQCFLFLYVLTREYTCCVQQINVVVVVVVAATAAALPPPCTGKCTKQGDVKAAKYTLFL